MPGGTRHMSATDAALLTAEEMLTLYARRALSPVEVLRAVAERITRLNPRLNAFAALNPHAFDAASKSEKRWRTGRPLGQLDGVPCTVKDLVDVAGFPTRRGSRTSDPDPVANDSPSVSRLKAAGAVIVGKTTTTEYGWKAPGDSPLYGITRNPWNPRCTTGGSSAGAGAAGAAGFGPLHIGTDAGGSIRIPAAWCGLVGLKPTFGRVPMWPASAFPGVSCLGPMTRTVRDAALMLSVIARYDARDPYCFPADARDWRAGIERGVSSLSVGLLSRPGFDAPVDTDGIAAVDRAAALLADAGANVDEAKARLPDTRLVFTQIWGATLARLVSRTPVSRRKLLDPGILQVARRLNEIGATQYLDAEAVRTQAAHQMARLHRRFALVLCPAVPAGPPPANAVVNDPVEALWTQWAPWTFPFNVTRQPALSIPLGLRADGLPNAVQLVAAQYREDLVLRAARVIEIAEPTPLPHMG
jgi:aspartyl-tRNA(Asn)/glutamyl-tRNA(Gln) amidotransferase subunit A